MWRRGFDFWIFEFLGFSLRGRWAGLALVFRFLVFRFSSPPEGSRLAEHRSDDQGCPKP